MVRRVGSAVAVVIVLAVAAATSDSSVGSGWNASSGVLEKLRPRVRRFNRGDPCMIAPAVGQDERWVSNGPLAVRQDLSIEGETVKPALSLRDSSLLSLRRVDKSEAKQHHLSKRDWVAVITHPGGELVLAAGPLDIAFLGVILRWTPPTPRP
jgi:hypothetical protein